ncbi:MAG: response regulator [Candidatus Electrothrix sp. ATG2]|nr:response regulator [Candidatus Electrothrix sp. ATG2]
MTTALVIEDNEDNRLVISLLLEDAGYQVRTADDGESGYQTAVALQPDFILLDIQLPDIDGTEVLRRLKKDSVTCGIPVIAVTSYAMSGDRERLLAAGCNGYLEKPIDPELIIAQIRKITGEG